MTTIIPMRLPEPIYIAIPHQLPPRVYLGIPPDDAHDMHHVIECVTVADLENLVNVDPRSDAHQRAKVAALAKRELERVRGEDSP